MLFKKCTKCRREFSKEKLEKEIESKKKKTKKDCPDCDSPLKTYDHSKFQKKWYGYLSDDKKTIDHLVLAEFKYFDDNSIEVKVPLLNWEFETKDFLAAVRAPDEIVLNYLRDNHNKIYTGEHKFLTAAFKGETLTDKQNVPVWWNK